MTAAPAALGADPRWLDMATLLDEPEEPVPWRVRPLVADWTLTTLAAAAGIGKTWLIYACAHVVQTDEKARLDGFVVEPGAAMLLDAEMGRQLIKKRFLAGDFSRDIQVAALSGFDLMREADQKWLWEAIEARRPQFLGIDSLRQIAPSADENSSNDMARVMTFIKEIAHTLGPATVLLHHEGFGERRTRGSSAIIDQSDAVWGMNYVDETDVLTLSCTEKHQKPPRYDEPPHRLFLHHERGVFTRTERPEPKAKAPKREEYKARLRLMPPVKHKVEWAKLLGVDDGNKTFIAACNELGAHQNGDGLWHIPTQEEPGI